MESSETFIFCATIYRLEAVARLFQPLVSEELVTLTREEGRVNVTLTDTAQIDQLLEVANLCLRESQ
jgi:hypothetical protein